MFAMRNNQLIGRLADHVAAQPDFKKSQPCSVSIYIRHCCYGGPEEGGWWYTRHEFRGGKPFLSREDAEKWLAAAKVEVERMNKEQAPARARAMARLPDEDVEPCPAGYSEGYIPTGWDDGGELEVVVEDVMGERDNMGEATPHYE